MKRTIKVEVKAPQYVTDTGITYAQADTWFGHSRKDLKLDIIHPEQGEKKSPCIVWICGGGWQQMSVSAHLAYLSEVARQGFVVASVQYRTSNEAVFPAQLEDVKAAIRYLKAHADRYCIDTDRFGVMGESAGGHLTALTALTGDRKEFDKGGYLEYSSQVQAACPWYLPSDITKMIGRASAERQAAQPESLMIGGHALLDKEKAEQACPVNYVTEQAPPFMLLHGTCDRTVPFSQSEEMYEALRKAGAEPELVAVEGADHAGLEFFQKEIWDMIIEFFKKTLPDRR